MEWNKVLFGMIAVFMLGMCGCSKQPGQETDGNHVQDWIQQETDTQESTDVAEEHAGWMLCIAGEQILLEDKAFMAEGESAFCAPDVLSGLDIVKDGMIPTYFLDENGLRCIGVEFEIDADECLCNVVKHYALLNKTLIEEEESVAFSSEFLRENGMLSFEFMADILGWEYQVDTTNKQIQVMEEFVEDVFYEPIFPEVVSNQVWNTDGVCVKADEFIGEDYKNKFSATTPETPIYVQAGEHLMVDYSLTWLPEIAGILFLNDADEVILYYNSSSARDVEKAELTVPPGATKMHVSFYANKTYALYRKVNRNVSKDYSMSESNYNELRYDAMKAKADSSWKRVYILFDKAQISFVLDDCRPDMDVIAGIFEEYNIPLCVAAVWEALYSPASKGDCTRMDVCRQVVANGGEILAHDAEVLTAEKLVDTSIMEKHFVFDKYQLEQFGFEVNGIIMAGGNGQVVGSTESDMWSRTYYRYSDLYGQQSLGEPYYHRRFWLGNCLDNYEEIISEAIAKKEWVSFYFHDLKEVNQDKLREILEYVNSVSNEAEVATYQQVYSNIYGVE